MSSVPHFYGHPLTLAYEFGPRHPLRPERLRRALLLFQHVLGVEVLPAEPTHPATLSALHDDDYLDALRRYSHGERGFESSPGEFGIGPGDCPPFDGMWESSLAYMGCTEAAAKAVASGAFRGYNIAGGLHHARRRRAAGFCLLNDPAWAIWHLREAGRRVAYVDLDVHHGEGVQYAWEHDAHVLTCSIHQDGRTLFPGTGAMEETGRLHNAVNVPLAPETSGDVWLWAFREAILPAIRQFRPEVLVVQCGTDAHALDPLARLRCRSQDWFAAIADLHALGLPAVVVGGGGYHLGCVPRMWLGAVALFAGLPLPESIPEPFASEWNLHSLFDPDDLVATGMQREHAEKTVRFLHEAVIPNVPGAPPITHSPAQ